MSDTRKELEDRIDELDLEIDSLSSELAVAEDERDALIAELDDIILTGEHDAERN